MRPERRNGHGGFDAEAAQNSNSDPSKISLLRAKNGLDNRVHLIIKENKAKKLLLLWDADKKRIGIAKSFRVDLKLSSNPDLILEGVIPTQFLGGQTEKPARQSMSSRGGMETLIVRRNR